MLSYYEHNTAFQTNNCNSGSNAAATYNGNANNDSIVNKRNNDHFEFDTHTFYQRPKRSKRDTASTRLPSNAAAVHNNNTTTTNNNIQYQKNIEITPLTPANTPHSTNTSLLNESEFYSETEEYMVHGYFGNSTHGITGAASNGSTSSAQHQYHILPAQNIIASQLPSNTMTTLSDDNIANDYMDID
ncbi:hypothetical protein N7582_004266 [Saccharomyces uvarum]|uniref:YML053C-like protein n=1 Tax=Saccharomyces uvarum TaxID=230603 RepID=A0AA35NJF0_SACUV|nr:hypothetical protein N7582_004266 [Saccharomyces uvarum]CAI4047990.1 hypothetical protein SUVC_13G0870 [Saccharomyces uvarum]